MTREELFSHLWNDYTQRLCPSAEAIQKRLQASHTLVNDHIALRTFKLESLGLEMLARPWLAKGYQVAGEYHFEKKKLFAQHLEHPDEQHAKIFISELLVEQCSDELNRLLRRLVSQVSATQGHQDNSLFSGRLWSLSYADYQTLAKESEYAAWVAAHGFGANHFTVSVNHLSQYQNLQQVNCALRQAGFTINSHGGEIKGSPECYLEQSSTMADKVPVRFDDGVHLIPGGFYEFAKRYPMASGKYYSGFVTESADKIFHSTDQS